MDQPVKNKQRVERFFKVLEKTQAIKYMNFETTLEKMQAILKFSTMVGIPENYLPTLVSRLRSATHNTDKPDSDEQIK